MAESTSSLESVVRGRPASIDEQLWPIACTTMVLVGILGVIVCVNSDFDEDRLFLNGYTHLAGLAVAAALLIYIASRLKGAARRTAELAILLSLALHAAAGVGAFYLFQSPLGGSSLLDAVRDAKSEFDDEPPSPDYHWAQDEEQQPEQAFEKVVATTIREQAPPAAQLQPRNLDRPAPATELPRVPNVEITPLGVGGVPDPSGPLDIRRPAAAKIEDAKPPEALVMVRQESDDLPLPKLESPAPAAMPEAPKEPPKTPEPAAQAEKTDKTDWASVARKAASPNNEPLPPPHKLARVEIQPGESLPSPNLVARLPSQAPPQTSNALSGPEAADRITQQGSTLERSNRDGSLLPSTVIPDAGLPAQSPAASGSSPPSRLEAVSTVPVEKSDTSRAPLGPTIASRGTQDYGAGSAIFPSRRGVIDGHGNAPPSIEGDSREDPAELRSGAPGSNLNQGLPLPSAPARRAIASQTEDGGSGLSASQAARLPRTQSEMGLNLPTATRIAENAVLSGAGGTASNPGGQTSMLDVGQRIALRRAAGSGAPSGVSRQGALSGAAVGDLLSGNDAITRGNVSAAVGRGPSGPRRVEQGRPEGDDNGVGSVPRAHSEAFDLRATSTPAGPVAGGSNVTGGSMPGGTSLGFGSEAIGPSAGLGGIGRRETAGHGIGLRPSSQVEPSEIASRIGVGSPQPSGVSGRGGRGDGMLDQVLSGGGSGIDRPGRDNNQVVVSGQVHEPMEPFRRGAVHGGLIIGDSSGGQLTEPAIENGLEYFSHTQFNDGHWSLHDLPAGHTADSAALGELHADTAATGLALLTYLGAGYTHQDDKYRDVVRRGAEWLVKHQQPDGNLSYQGSDPTHFYSQGIATMALCEAYGMTQDRELREPAQKAIDYIVKSQDSRRGGWRYRPQDGSDTSVTGWQLMALKSARMAGLEVPEETLRKVSRWLDLAQVPNRGTYVYNPWNTDSENPLGRAPNPTMTAQAMIMRMYLGQDRENASLAQGADYLLANLPDVGTLETSHRDCYYWYHATQAMYHLQGDYWKTWDARVTPLLRAGQIDRGPLRGSWSPGEPVPDRWSAHGGRHYVTSMHLLTLEFRYWHLPLFRELRKEEDAVLKPEVQK
ncbi:MAG: hypothetical protein ACLP9L_32805 [Thermoguttaceae bacterium]